MQAPRVYTVDELPADLEPDLEQTFLVASVCKLTSSEAPVFGQLLIDLEVHRTTRAKLVRAVAMPDVAVLFLDDDLNVLLDETKTEVGTLPAKEGAVLSKQLFGEYSPSELRRFLLGEQLETQRLWPGHLGKGQSPALQDLGDRTDKAVVRTDVVLKARGEAQTALDKYILGPWTAYISACNAARAALFGKVLEMSKDPASGPLPPDFVDRFFLRDTSGRALRLDELDQVITRLTNQLARVTAQREAVVEKKKSSLLTKKKRELAKKKAKITAKQKGMADEAAEIAALEAEIAKEEAP